MSRYTQFIAARLDENTTIPEHVVTALRTLADMHDGLPDCDGCGLDGREEGVRAEQCEQAHAIAQIWHTHPDYPGRPEHRARLLDAEPDGRLYIAGSDPVITAKLARRTPAGVYLTPRGRELLPADHEAHAPAGALTFDWGSDPFPCPVPSEPTHADVNRHPKYYIFGPGRELAAATRCEHGVRLTVRCNTCTP